MSKEAKSETLFTSEIKKPQLFIILVIKKKKTVIRKTPLDKYNKNSEGKQIV